ncbi:putative glycosyltransferase EpsJ [Halomonas sp. THAF5a]|nr:putative glycosyltransferase EpsJ [Halomonas sp. THAF5a]
MIAVSIIVPCFNAYSKIGRCLASLRSVDFPRDNYEVIFVDDKSTDGTYEMLRNECEKEKNWSVTQLQENSGSPSKPRNEGVKLADGEYVFYLDCDDEILPNTLENYYDHAKKTHACIVRGDLIADNGKKRTVMNKIAGWNPQLSIKERVEAIVSKQSTTITQLIKKKLLLENEIKWPEKIKMGEDTVFLVDVLVKAKNIEYLPHPTFVYNKMPAISLSTTQAYGKKELLDHLYVWKYAQNKLLSLGVDYSKIRLNIGLQAAIKSLIHNNKYDIDKDAFLEFKKTLRLFSHEIEHYNLSFRFKQIVNEVISGSYAEFTKLCRPRLLIAGHDFKFIQPAEAELCKYFSVKYDKWNGHDVHDEEESLKLLGWAEVIWCEWMLGNSVWYSKNKKSYQKLVVRMHRQELSTAYAEAIDFSNVDLVFSVSALFFERLLERFPNIPRSKARLVPNYIDAKKYDRDWHPDRLYTLGMIGILPSKKNFHAALEILKNLRLKDSRYKLFVYSKKPKELAWLARNKEEMDYFDQCESYIKENNLVDAVEFKGHCDLKKSLAENRVGFILSLSESVVELPGFESFHLAVADGFASGGVSLIKRWAGCEYIFPEEIIKNSLHDVENKVFELSNDEDAFKKMSKFGRDFLEGNYMTNEFASIVRSEVSQL